MKAKWLILIFSLFILSSCSNENITPTISQESEITKLKTDLSSLEAKQQEYEIRLEEKSSKVEELDSTIQEKNKEIEEKNEKIKFYEEYITKLKKNKEISKNDKFYAKYIDSKENLEATNSYIYSLDYNVYVGGRLNVVDVNTGKKTTFSGDFGTIQGFEVSQDDNYIAINEEDITNNYWNLKILKLPKLMNKSEANFLEDLILYNINMLELIDPDGDLYDNDGRHIYNYDFIEVYGFSKGNKVLWGSIGGEAAMFYYFYVNLESGEVTFINPEDYQRYLDQYPLEPSI